jgi:hypothetical protein
MPSGMAHQRKRKGRQLSLTEHSRELPHWATLPVECRREVVELVAKLLRSETIADDEVVDE